MGHFADLGGLDGHVGRLAQFFADVVCHLDEALPLPVGEVDGVVLDVAGDEPFQTGVDAADAVIDVGEVEDFVFAEDGDGTAGVDFLDEVGDDSQHALDVVVVTAVYIAETEDEIAQPVTLGVGVDERLAGDFTGGVGAFGEGEVGVGFFGDVAVDVAVDLAGTAEDEWNLVVTAVFQHVPGHGDVFQSAVGLLYQFMYFGVGG